MSRLGIWFLIACGAVTSSPQARKSTSVVNLRYEEPVRNGLYPELLYWFVTPETLAPERYTHDVQHIAHDTEFDFPFLTAREGVSFTGNKPAHDAVAGIVKEAHENGLRIGVSLGLGDGSAAKSASPDEQQTVVADGEGVLDAQGVGNFEASIKLRSLIPQKTELLRAWAFRKAGPGEYDAAYACRRDLPGDQLFASARHAFRCGESWSPVCRLYRLCPRRKLVWSG